MGFFPPAESLNPAESRRKTRSSQRQKAGKPNVSPMSSTDSHVDPLKTSSQHLETLQWLQNGKQMEKEVKKDY